MRIVSGYRRDNPDSKVFIVVDGEALHAFRQAEAVAGAASCYLHLSSPLDDCDVPAEAMGHLFRIRDGAARRGARIGQFVEAMASAQELDLYR